LERKRLAGRQLSPNVVQTYHRRGIYTKEAEKDDYYEDSDLEDLEDIQEGAEAIMAGGGSGGGGVVTSFNNLPLPPQSLLHDSFFSFSLPRPCQSLRLEAQSLRQDSFRSQDSGGRWREAMLSAFEASDGGGGGGGGGGNASAVNATAGVNSAVGGGVVASPNPPGNRGVGPAGDGAGFRSSCGTAGVAIGSSFESFMAMWNRQLQASQALQALQASRAGGASALPFSSFESYMAAQLQVGLTRFHLILQSNTN
jgi:hypothetical protein